jgi:predicted membrane protein
MITPGSKYFLGLTGLGLVSAVLYCFLVNPSDLGAYALFGLFISAALIAGFSMFTRDGDVDTVAEAVEANTEATAPSFWPIVFALGGALTLLGVATNEIVFVLGLAVLVGGAVEWVIDDWSEKASADSAFNSFVRHRAIGAFDYPGIAAVVLGVVAFLFSRIMLTVSKDEASIIFIIVSALIFATGFLLSAKPALRGKSTAIISVVGVLVLAVAGITSALNGERKELVKYAKEDPYSISHRECGKEAGEHYDHEPNGSVSLRSAVVATIFVENGKIRAQEVGLKRDVETITIPRSNATNILFRNLDTEEYRLVATLGKVKVGTTDVMEEVGTCTQLTGKNEEQVLTVNIPKPSNPEEPYTLTVPGVTGEIKVVVP